jgi:hypothetical protein
MREPLMSRIDALRAWKEGVVKRLTGGLNGLAGFCLLIRSTGSR